jgi:mRNA (guanine-N7-)-methyltransferase
MAYPTTPAMLKHDLLDLSGFYIQNKARRGIQHPPLLTKALEGELGDASDAPNSSKIATLYSYSDAPSPPPSSSLRILSFLSLKNTSLANLDPQKSLPSMTLASKLPQHCTPATLPNATSYTAFLNFLKQFALCAVVKLNSSTPSRIGILTPTGECVAKVTYANDWVAIRSVVLRKATSTPLPDASSSGSADNVTLWRPEEYSEESTAMNTAAMNTAAMNTTAMNTGNTTTTIEWITEHTPDATSTPSTSAKPPSDDIQLWRPDEFEDAAMSDAALLTTVEDDDDAMQIDQGAASFSSGSTDVNNFPNGNSATSYHSNTQPATSSSAASSSAFHSNTAAAAADTFYSTLNRSLESSHQSHIYHMRKLNNYIKSKLISNCRPKSCKKGGLAVLDLACGKGGDLGKFSLHPLGMRRYVGCDVARGSLRDAATRVLENRSLGGVKQLAFVVADLGSDVLGGTKQQQLLTWTKPAANSGEEIVFNMQAGGSVSAAERFDLISCQFAIHYFFSEQRRAERFFQTVGQLLAVGGQLIVTTIDARIIGEKIMSSGKVGANSDIRVEVGEQCTLKFEANTIDRMFSNETYGLEYQFQLRDGKGNAGDVGEAVDLPEWLCPTTVISELASRAGLHLVEHANFHKYYSQHSGTATNPDPGLYKMRVLGVDGKVSQNEWDISRLYCCMVFEKSKESRFNKDAKDKPPAKEKQPPAAKLDLAPPSDAAISDMQVAMSMSKVKAQVGEEKWSRMSTVEKTEAVKEYIRSNSGC